MLHFYALHFITPSSCCFFVVFFPLSCVWTVSCCELSPGWRGYSGILCCFFLRSPPTSHRSRHTVSHISQRWEHLGGWDSAMTKTFTFITWSVGYKRNRRHFRATFARATGSVWAHSYVCVCVCVCRRHREKGEKLWWQRLFLSINFNM